MSRYKMITENVTNAYILDEEENTIVALCTTKRPDLGFEKLKELIEKANKNVALEKQLETTIKMLNSLGESYNELMDIADEILYNASNQWDDTCGTKELDGMLDKLRTFLMKNCESISGRSESDEM